MTETALSSPEDIAAMTERAREVIRLNIEALDALERLIRLKAARAVLETQAERLGDMVREQQVEASKSSAVLEGVEMRMEDESLPAPETAPQP